jgi:hypothetical protein
VSESIAAASSARVSCPSRFDVGSPVPMSASVSSSERLSPRSPPPDTTSSSAATVTNEIWVTMSCSSERLTPRCSAISVSVGARFSVDSSSALALSTSRALNRTDRGTQSSARSSSMMAPLIRGMAYVSNLISRARSNFSSASMRPKIPYETRSACSTFAGNPVATRLATYFTSGE